MIFDLHVHQDQHSKDSQLNIEDAIMEAKTLGLDGLCITDHDDLGLRKQTKALMAKHDFLLIVGVEIYTLEGDLLCYGIDEIPDRRLSAQATIDFVHDRGGVCIAAHPYRHNNRGLKDVMYSLEGLDAIEVYNGRTDYQSNQKAYDVAKTLNIPMTGSSDAHQLGEIGTFVTRFFDKISSETDFINAMKSGRYVPELVIDENDQSA